MKVCFPVLLDEGMNSIVYNHFGSAPTFVVVDTDTFNISSITNQDQQHDQGACNPTQALANEKVDAVVVGGIGAGALGKLNQMGITVHRSMADTIQANLSMLKSNSLPVLKTQGCCGSHGKASGCAHKH